MEQDALIKGLGFLCSDEQYQDIVACAAERGLDPGAMCLQVVLDDIAR